MTGDEIMHLALKNLHENTHIVGKWIEDGGNQKMDGKLILEIEPKTYDYAVDIKKELRNHQIDKVLELNQLHDNTLMVVALHLFPKIKEELRLNNIAYMEANGNIYLKNKDQFIWIELNEPIKLKRKIGNRAFTKTGLKVVFEFLRDEKLVNETYRVIAQTANTAIGNIGNIVNGLLQEKFLLQVAKNEYKLMDKKKLLTKWITAYDTYLKPTIKVGTFRFLKEEEFANWKNLPLKKNKTWWGGEPAGDLLTNYLRPEGLTLYTTETRNELIKNYRLIPDDNGNVKVFQKFWNEEKDITNPQNNDGIAPPLLVYADLINTNDRRCAETAQKIYEQYLQNQF